MFGRINLAYLVFQVRDLTHWRRFAVDMLGLPISNANGEAPLALRLDLAGVLEVAGGLLIGFGLFTRPTAFVLSGMMAVAYFMAHAPQGNVIAPMLNGGELAALYSFVFLLFAVTGAGALSLDGRKQRAALSELATA